MPPRHVYWTIIYGNQATSFRAATPEELLPTLKQLQSRHPDAVLKYFARGRLWNSAEEARARQDDRRRDDRWNRGPRESRPRQDRRPLDRPRESRPRDDRRRFERPQDSRPREDKRPFDRPRESRPREDKRPFDRPRESQPRGDKRPFDRPRESRPREDKRRFDRPREEQWRRGNAPADEREHPNQKPGARDNSRKPEGERRGKDWRPGGEHRDPRDRWKVPRAVKRKRFAQRLRRPKKDKE